MPTMAKPWKHPDSGIYYHRIEVPKDIREAIGKQWIKTSLKTKNFSEAKRLFALQYAQTQSLFEQARSKVSLTPKDIEVLSQRWFEGALRDIEEEGNQHLYLVGYEGGGVGDVNDHIADALELGYERQHKCVGGFVSQVLADNGVLLLEGSEDYQRLTEKICWRFLELSKLALDRHYDDWVLPRFSGHN